MIEYCTDGLNATITENGINVKYEDSSTDYSDDGSILNDEIEMNNPLLMQASRIFDADHPFIYFISDKRKNILWIGRYTADEHGTAINEEIGAIQSPNQNQYFEMLQFPPAYNRNDEMLQPWLENMRHETMQQENDQYIEAEQDDLSSIDFQDLMDIDLEDEMEDVMSLDNIEGLLKFGE
ncbi:putative serpin-like protein [Dirofilaria immitis]